MNRNGRFFSSAASILALLGTVAAHGQQGDQGREVSSDEAQRHAARNLSGIDHFQVNPFDGALNVTHDDIVLPGNGALDIRVGWSYSPQGLGYDWSVKNSGVNFGREFLNASWSPLGVGWRLSIAPRLLRGPGLSPRGSLQFLPVQDAEDNACGGFGWERYVLQLPDGKTETFYSDASTYLTKTNWKLTCEGGLKRLRSPDGMAYELGVKQGIWPLMYSEGDPRNTLSYAYDTTRAIDANGNSYSITYATQVFPSGSYDIFRSDAVYSNLLPSRITASDGRQLDFEYAAGESVGRTSYLGRAPRLQAIRANDGRTWRFEHADGPQPFALLNKVLRPDATFWRYDYHPPETQSAYSATTVQNISGSRLKSETNPQGGMISIEYTPSAQFVSNMAVRTQSCQGGPGGCSFQNPGLVLEPKVASLTTSEGHRWLYSYQLGARDGQLDVTTVDSPKGREVYKHVGFGYFARQPIPYTNYSFSDNGDLWRFGLLVEYQLNNELSQAMEWVGQEIFNTYDWTFVVGPQVIIQSKRPTVPVLTRVRIVVNGAVHGTAYGHFDSYRNPGLVTATGPHGGNRSTTRTYFNNPSKWIIGRLQDESYAGSTTIRSHDASGNLLSHTQDGVVTSFTYDSEGNVATKTLPRGLVHAYSSYKRGIPQVENQPENVVVSRVVSDAGTILSETNAEDKTVFYTYDGLNRVTSITYPQGNPQFIAYTATSKTATRGPLEESTQYDGFGRPASVTLGGVKTTYRHDALGRRVFESNPGSTLGTTYQFDAQDRLTRITHADNTYQVHSHGAASKTVTDENGKSTTFHYRSYGDPSQQFVMSVTAPEVAANMSLTRNARDLVTSVIQGGITRTFGYNANYYLSSATHPETGTTTYGRDAAGNMTSYKVGTSALTTFTYDNRNRLTAINYPAGTPSVSKVYTPTDRLLSVASSVAKRGFDYDDNGNLALETLQIDGRTFTIGYAYNANDQLSALTYPQSGFVLDYAPDALGRPTKAGSLISSVSYWPSGQFKQITYANGTVSSYGQNSRLWPSWFNTTKGGANYLNSAYGYDGSGNLLAITDAVDAAYNRTLQYDGLNRITTAIGPWGMGTISYDGRGNITNQTLGHSTLSYTYDAANRLSALSGAKTASLTYDVYGNVTTGVGAKYTFNSVPNLTCAANSTGNCMFGWTYAYDGLNRRVKASTSGVAMYEMTGTNGNQLIEYTPAQAVTVVEPITVPEKLIEFIYLGNKRVAQRVTQ